MQNSANLMPGTSFYFKIKVFSRDNKETTLVRYFIKVTARPRFTQLRVIRRINKVKYENRKSVTKIQLYLLLLNSLVQSRKFYIRRNNSKADSIEIRRIVIILIMIKFYRHYLIYKYNFMFSLFCMTYKLTNDKKII